jgi:hypothetical protein
MPLFNVTIEYECVVEADDVRDAENKARRDIDDITRDEEAGVSALPLRKIKMPDGKKYWTLPNGYELDALPWCSNSDKTIGEILGDPSAGS